ncbi:MAG: LLM class flavin-dependent oxidoreductase [Candidatus Binatia bacterium]
MRFGLHAGPQDCTIADLRRLWRIADTTDGIDWCSVWDHLYSVSEPANPEKPAFEAVATMAALASETKRVRVGCLVFCVGYRPVGVLAKAAVTIDHLSGGRCEFGLGAGWNPVEYQAFGLPWREMKDRLDHLEEAAGALRRLFAGDKVTMAGRHVRLENAFADPRPVQPTLPLWIGGQGERRLLRMVARHADGWNVPFLSPETWTRKNRILDQWCERERRDPRAIQRTVNVGLAIGADAAAVGVQEARLAQMFGPLADLVRPGILVGTPAQVIDRVGAYRDAGVERLVVALRAPFDWEGLDLFIRDVLPAFR